MAPRLAVSHGGSPLSGAPRPWHCCWHFSPGGGAVAGGAFSAPRAIRNASSESASQAGLWIPLPSVAWWNTNGLLGGSVKHKAKRRYARQLANRHDILFLLETHGNISEAKLQSFFPGKKVVWERPQRSRDGDWDVGGLLAVFSGDFLIRFSIVSPPAPCPCRSLVLQLHRNSPFPGAPPIQLHVVAVHLTETAGRSSWHQTMHAVTSFVRQLVGTVVLVGDMNCVSGSYERIDVRTGLHKDVDASRYQALRRELPGFQEHSPPWSHLNAGRSHMSCINRLLTNVPLPALDSQHMVLRAVGGSAFLPPGGSDHWACSWTTSSRSSGACQSALPRLTRWLPRHEGFEPMLRDYLAMLPQFTSASHGWKLLHSSLWAVQEELEKGGLEGNDSRVALEILHRIMKRYMEGNWSAALAWIERYPHLGLPPPATHRFFTIIQAKMEECWSAIRQEESEFASSLQPDGQQLPEASWIQAQWASWKQRSLTTSTPTIYVKDNPCPSVEEEMFVISEHWRPIFDAPPPRHPAAGEPFLRRLPALHWPACELPEEVVRHVVRKSKDSAPGPSGVLYSTLRGAEAYTVQLIQHAFVEVRDGGTFPKDWDNSELVMLPKVSAPQLSPHQLRPISLLEVPMKIVYRCVSYLLLPLLGQAITAAQRGFLPGRTPLEAFMSLEEKALTLGGACRDSCLLAMDFSAAFPSVSRAWCLECLSRTGAPEGWMRIFGAMMAATDTQLVWRQARGPLLRMGSGTPQGHPCSSLVFLLAIEGFIRQVLYLLGPGGDLAAYADDLTLLLSRMDMLVLVEEQFLSLRISSGLALNASKCKLLPLHRGLLQDIQRRLDGLCSSDFLGVTAADCVKILGFLIWRDGCEATTDQAAHGRLRAAMDRVRSTEWGAASRLFLMRHAAAPVIYHVMRGAAPNPDLLREWRAWQRELAGGSALAPLLPHFKPVLGMHGGGLSLEATSMELQLAAARNYPTHPFDVMHRILQADEMLAHPLSEVLRHGCWASWCRTVLHAERLGLARHATHWTLPVSGRREPVRLLLEPAALRRALRTHWCGTTESAIHNFSERVRATLSLCRMELSLPWLMKVFLNCRRLGRRHPAACLSALRFLALGERRWSHSHTGDCCLSWTWTFARTPLQMLLAAAWRDLHDGWLGRDVLADLADEDLRTAQRAVLLFGAAWRAVVACRHALPLTPREWC